MMNTLKHNWTNLRHTPLGETIALLEKGFAAFELDFYLIGAFARDIWLENINGLPRRRRTADVDFAVYINRHTEYEQLKTYLVQTLGFRQDAQSYRLVNPNDIMVDLLPFGGIEKNGEVFLEGRPPLEMSVLGTRQVTAEAVIVEGAFKVITLPGLCILKLVAFSEKPGSRAKDLQDFYYLLENYFTIAGHELYETPHDDLLEGDYDPDYAAARLLGRQIQQVASPDAALLQVVTRLLQERLERFSYADINQMIAAHGKADTAIFRMKLLAELLRGMADDKKQQP